MKEDLYQQMHLQEKYYWWHIAKRRLVIDFIRREKWLKVAENKMLNLVNIPFGLSLLAVAKR